MALVREASLSALTWVSRYLGGAREPIGSCEIVLRSSVCAHIHYFPLKRENSASRELNLLLSKVETILSMGLVSDQGQRPGAQIGIP